jgi:hypothetical protein
MDGCCGLAGAGAGVRVSDMVRTDIAVRNAVRACNLDWQLAHFAAQSQKALNVPRPCHSAE